MVGVDQGVVVGAPSAEGEAMVGTNSASWGALVIRRDEPLPNDCRAWPLDPPEYPAEICPYCGDECELEPSSMAGEGATGYGHLCQECERQAREYYCIECGALLPPEQTPVRANGGDCCPEERLC